MESRSIGVHPKPFGAGGPLQAQRRSPGTRAGQALLNKGGLPARALPAAPRGGRETMCGIIGVVGMPNAARAIIAGLKRLEYRGYDSAGLAIVTRGGLDVQRAVGAVRHLDALPHASGTAGVGHTRRGPHRPPPPANPPPPA